MASTGGVEQFEGFRPAALKFLRSLARNNNKEWFEVNRATYEREIKRPLQLLVEEVDARLGSIAPELTGNPRRSIFRIHRDVRFSRDKSPYKTNAACWFRHRDAGHSVGTQAVHGGAGLYFQIAPGECIIAGGIWMPPASALKELRTAIAEDHVDLERILSDAQFRGAFGKLSEDSMLTRPPRGFGADHPALRLLRYKSFTVSAPIAESEIADPRLPDALAARYRIMLPFVRWLNGALGLRPATRR